MVAMILEEILLISIVPLVEIKNLKTLVDDKLFFDQPIKINKKHMESMLKCQEIIIIQQETYHIICTINIIYYMQIYI